MFLFTGEEDQDSYDINRLKKPVDDNRPTPKLNGHTHTSPPEKVMPPEPKPAPVQRRGKYKPPVTIIYVYRSWCTIIPSYGYLVLLEKTNRFFTSNPYEIYWFCRQ